MTPVSRTVFLNGDYLPAREAMISVDDRGFLFADACYEASPAFDGRFLLLNRHLARLQRGLDELRIDFDAATISDVHQELLKRNGQDNAELAMIYVQVTRGVAARSHAFPSSPVAPTVYLSSSAVKRMTRDEFEAGFTAVTVEDLRWARPDIKTTGLLPNVLAQQEASERGVHDAALFHREVDGSTRVTEGAHNNIFIVRNGQLMTAPIGRAILPGITRQHLIELARGVGLDVGVRTFTVEEMLSADEVFFCGTTTEVRPTVSIDDHPIGAGVPGPVTRRINDLYQQHIRSL